MHEQGRVRGRLVEPGVLRVEVDGVPVYWAEGDASAPAEGGLVFRVGRADETLATAGISRLVAGWAAASAGIAAGIAAGGAADVGPVLTGVRCAGTAEEVVRFLTSAASALTALVTTDDVVPVRRALSASAPGPSPAAVALGLRFGARGPGLLRHVEYGLSWLSAPVAVPWRDRWFTAENAAAWIIAPELHGLELDLRDGARQLAPILPPARLAGPAAARWQSESATVALLRPPSPSLSAALAAARANGASVESHTLDRGVMHAAVTVASAGQLLALLDPVLDEADIEAPACRPDDLIAWCQGELLDSRVAPAAERLAARAKLTDQEVGEAWHAALDTAIYLLPHGVTIADDRVGPVAVWGRPPLGGADHRPVTPDPAHPDKRLVVEPTALTLVIDSQRAVRAALAGATALRFADGSRGLWSDEGVYLDLQPGDWEAGEEVIAAVDRAVPVARTVPLLSARPPLPPTG